VWQMYREKKVPEILHAFVNSGKLSQLHPTETFLKGCPAAAKRPRKTNAHTGKSWWRRAPPQKLTGIRQAGFGWRRRMR
jgi:hypothetical protein